MSSKAKTAIKNKLKHEKAIGSMLGVAYGDALGWPYERDTPSFLNAEEKESQQKLKSWYRKTGGRYNPYTEKIEAGEYSDDTQLTLCVGRSLLKGENWLKHFTEVELPFWYSYERGGGGATKHSIKSWLLGKSPWDNKRDSKDVERYANAGGNGVSMRILPHILYSSESDFSEIGFQILLDGIATHGHPRALLGALVYGYSLYHTFKAELNTDFGNLIETLICSVEEWSNFPQKNPIIKEWKDQCIKINPQYTQIWKQTKEEVIGLLEMCEYNLKNNNEQMVDEVLEKLNCFDKKSGASGTITSVASIYLATFYHKTPLKGVIKPATTVGIDTDTISSMTAGLLGCMCGGIWLPEEVENVQDGDYICKLATNLVNKIPNEVECSKSIKNPFLENWKESVAMGKSIELNKLPDGRVVLSEYLEKIEKPKFTVFIRKLELSDGQSIYVKKLKRQKDQFVIKSKKDVPSVKSDLGKSKVTKKTLNQKTEAVQSTSEKSSLFIAIPVRSIGESIRFYQDCLGLEIKEQDSKRVLFVKGLKLAKCDNFDKLSSVFDSEIVIERSLSNFEEVREKIKKNFAKLEISEGNWGEYNRPCLECNDPNGYNVKIFSVTK